MQSMQGEEQQELLSQMELKQSIAFEIIDKGQGEDIEDSDT